MLRPKPTSSQVPAYAIEENKDFLFSAAVPAPSSWAVRSLALARGHLQLQGVALAVVRHWNCLLEGAAKAQIGCGGHLVEKLISHKLSEKGKIGNPSSCGSAEHQTLVPSDLCVPAV